MAEDTLTLRRLRVECRAHGARAADRSLALLTRIAGSALGPAASPILAAALPDDWRGDDAVVLVPRLEIDLDVDIDGPPEAVARAWARALAAGALRAAAGADAIRFASPPARLAAFLADLAGGRAWGQWAWRDFDGLRALDASAAARTALLRDPAAGLAALRAMPAPARDQLFFTLSADDAALVLDEIVAATPPDPHLRPLAALAALGVDRASGASLAARASPAHFALALLAGAPAAAPLAARLGPAAVLDMAAALVAARGPSAAPGPAPGPASPGAPPAGPGSLVSAAHGSRGRPPAAAPAAPFQTVTPFGGGFLLWPHLLEVADAALAGAAPARDRLRLAALALALGAPPEALAADRALATLVAPSAADPEAPRLDLASLDGWFAAEGVRAAEWRPAGRLRALKADAQGYWLRLARRRCRRAFPPASALPSPPEIDVRDAETLRAVADPLAAQLAQIACKRLAWRLPGFANASVGHLRRNLLSMNAEVVAGVDRIEVRLGRAPLGALLNLTGMGRQRYPLPDGRTVALAQGDAP